MKLQITRCGMCRVLAALFALTLATTTPCLAGVASSAVRETAEVLMRKFGREVGEESAEALSKRVAEVGARYGDEGLEALRKVGPRAFQKISVEAGEHASAVVKLTAKYGDEAVWVVSRPKGLAIFVKYGEAGATAVMKHPGIAEEAVERMGAPAARALNAVSSQQGRRLGMMIEDGAIKAGDRSPELLDVVARYGDKAMEFIWKHKGALAVGAGLTAFLNDPQPFIDGTKNLVSETIKPAMIEAARRTNWTPVIVTVVLMSGGLIAWRLSRRDKRAQHAV